MARISAVEIKFKIGQRVRLSDAGRKQLCNEFTHNKLKPTTRGKVVGLVPPHLVRILPDGYKQPCRFHYTFWEAARWK